ncbi:MAG: hypothetical protein JWP89_1567 [Schlesneria sp.]|nr:hypothetical protein [Schlesneria sp.]
MTAVLPATADGIGVTVIPSRNWLVSPAFDALMVANVTWPLILLLQFREGFEGRAGLQFWQVYFVTTPHRWITLALVFLDRERFRQRRFLFVGILVCAIAICTTVRITTGALTCLLTIDYIWNAWHFAAQHQGIYRIYGRLTEVAPPRQVIVERWLLRFFLLYVTLRVAIATWSSATSDSIFATLDWVVPAVPLALLVRDAANWTRVARGRLLYLASVSSLYLGLLWAVHFRKPGLALALTTASALFHAVEYLAVVSWSVRKRNANRSESRDWLGIIATQWSLSLGAFLVVLGSGAWLLDQGWAEHWLFLNVVVAFLHYAFDGVIWRHRPARTSGLSAS